ncbi:MAG: hypothetical protein V2A73_11025, partial [Pseudomonadota bacterium]
MPELPGQRWIPDPALARLKTTPPPGCDRCSLVPVDGGETRASAIPDVDVSRSDGHDKAPEGAQAVLGLWS